MTAIRTPALSRFIAEQIIESVSEVASSNLYLTIGRVTKWANSSIADTPVNTIDENIGIWNNMHFAKKITGNDMSMVTRRIDWTANTVYDAYAHNVDLSALNYYVMTSDFNVYKCLENNNGAQSTVEPTYTGITNTNRTSDGYLWKFLYKVSRAQRLRFLTNEWLPVKKLSMNDGSVQWGVQDSAIGGSIDAIKVTSGGNGFSSNITSTVTISGDGSGAYANAIANSVTNTIQYITVTSRGAGYTWANVSIVSSNTSVANGVTANVIISPPYGHGADPLDELGATGLMINVRLKGTENSLLEVGNDFRQVSLLRDPVVADTGNVASNTIISQVMSITLSGSGGDFDDDEWVYQGASLTSATFKARVIYYNNNMMEVANISGTIRSTTLIGKTSSASRFVADYTDQPLTPFSGQILYIDNRLPITRASDQTENIQIPIIF